MTTPAPWVLRTGRCVYAVRLEDGGRWAELAAWGPLGAETGPSPLDWSRRTHFLTPADLAPAEYVPYGLRPFTGADLTVQFGRGEELRTEISAKFRPEGVRAELAATGFVLRELWTDARDEFGLTLAATD